MTIQVTDIQLLASERLTDADDGGGKMTGTVIESGQVNNLFPDISRLDRTYGRLSLRKAFMSVRSQNTDTYLGAHVIVTDPPADDKVSVTMFTTGSPSDLRINAQDRIESYLTAGPLSAYYLFGNQPKGAKAITLLGRVEAVLPDVGDVLLLSVETNAVVTAQQYVRITDIKTEIRTFTDSQGDYQRKVVTLTLTSVLRQTYLGAEASRLSGVTPPTLVRITTVADASTYYGVSTLAAPASANDLAVRVNAIHAQLVPSTTREVAVAGARPGLALSYVAVAVAQALTTGASPVYQMRGVLPGSLVATVSQGAGADDGTGGIVVNHVTVGAVDYESGRLSGTSINGGTYVPAATISGVARTLSQDVTLATQGTVYAVTLPSIPAPGTLTVSFRYLGKWYDLTDAARDGSIAGVSASNGAGTINYQTGDVAITLGAVPDVGSKVIFAWGDPTSIKQMAGNVTVKAPVVMFMLSRFPLNPGSLTLAWQTGGVNKSATVDAAGVITGDAAGSVIYLTGRVLMQPAANAFPDSSSTITATYTQAAGAKDSVVGSYTGGTLTFTLPASVLPLKPGMVSGTISGFANNRATDLCWKDDGSGNIVTAPELAKQLQWSPPLAGDPAGYPPIIAVASGTIDYTTGAVIIHPGNMSVRLWQPTSMNSLYYTYGDWINSDVLPNFVALPVVQFSAQRDVVDSTPQVDAVDYPGVSFVLTRTTVDPILPGSVWFTWGGKTYVDRQGKLFRDVNASNGSGVEAGTIDYATGAVTLDRYGTSTGGAVALKSLATQYGSMPITVATFRMPGSPIRPASFSMSAIRFDTGETISATSDAVGVVTGSMIAGTINSDMGWASVRFGSYVPAAGNENEPWYNPDTIVGSNVWKPALVNPETVRFNCVVQTTLPLDADLLGIDPVRLPLTGKVPIFRDGDVVVIHDDRTAALPAGFGSGSTFTLPDAPIAQCALVDATGAAVPIAGYTVDTDTATITGTANWDVSALTAPFTVQYTVEDMLLVSTADLAGNLSLVAPVSRDYPQGAKVSSALLFGDLQAQNPVFFSQQTWTNVWSDTLIGSTTTAQYNRTQFPLQIVNANAVTERWALIFTSPTNGTIVGETLGQIGQFSTTLDAAPVNALTGQPFFKLLASGWGSGWGVNNVLRFNTVGPNAPIWVARTVLPGAAALQNDQFRVQMRGDTQ